MRKKTIDQFELTIKIKEFISEINKKYKISVGMVIGALFTLSHHAFCMDEYYDLVREKFVKFLEENGFEKTNTN